MNCALIGFGQAGGKIVDALCGGPETRWITAAIAVNTATTDLDGLDHVPRENRILIGQARVRGHGVGADNELGSQVASADIDEIQHAIDRMPTHEIDAFLIVSGLGGGTGSGGAPVLARHLNRIYTHPVYGLGILPATDEGGIYTLNAARSFQTFVREVDNLLVFDNDAWYSAGESVESGYDRLNEEIAQRLRLLFNAGELRDGDCVAESVVDSSEIINTLSDGVSTIGYASESVGTDDGLLTAVTGNNGSTDGLLGTVTGRNSPDQGESVTRLTSLVRKATLGQLTLPCDVASADRGLVIATGPPEYLSRKGIERGRQWLEDETATMEIRGGDFPLPDADEVGILVVLSGVTDVPRIERLQQIAIDSQETTKQVQATADDDFEALMDTNGELDALF